MGFLLRCEWQQIDRRAAMIGGAVLLLTALCCAWATGRPVYVRHLFMLPACMPPSAVMVLFGGLLYALLGAEIAVLFASVSPAQLRERFAGILFMSAAALFRLLWYPLFFGALAPALALVTLICALFLLLCAIRVLYAVHKTAALLACLQLPWLVWLFFATGGVLLLN